MTAISKAISCDASDGASAVATYAVLHYLNLQNSTDNSWRPVSQGSAVIDSYRLNQKMWFYLFNPNN